MSKQLFQTPRLSVRQIDSDDFDALFAVYSDPLAMRWVGDGSPISVEDCRRWIDVTKNNYSSRGYGLSAIELTASGEIIGFGGLVHPNQQTNPEIKYAFLQRHWGLGFASEFIPAMLRYGFESFSLTEIIATVAAENLASRHLLEKAGLSQIDSIAETDGSTTLVYQILQNSDSPKR